MVQMNGGAPAGVLRILATLAQVPAWRMEAQEVARMGNRAAQAGGGRVVRLAAAMQALPVDAQRDLVDALNEVLRPMTPRQLERALTATDLNYRQRRAVVAAIKHLDIAAVALK